MIFEVFMFDMGCAIGLLFIAIILLDNDEERAAWWCTFIAVYCIIEAIFHVQMEDFVGKLLW